MVATHLNTSPSPSSRNLNTHDGTVVLLLYPLTVMWVSSIQTTSSMSISGMDNIHIQYVYGLLCGGG